MILKIDQCSQFTSTAFTAVLHREQIAIRMDGESSWRDNVFVERLWRSVKYEEVFLNAYYASVPETRLGIGRYSASTTSTGLTPASADEHRTRYMGGSEQRHIRGMPRIWRSPAWRRKTTGGIA